MSDQSNFGQFDLNALGMFDAAFLGVKPSEKPEPKLQEKEEDQDQPKIKTFIRKGKRHISRKVTSEKSLESSLPWHFEEGDCYHCFSFGDVDSMTFFKMVLRQQHVKYLALSTWCMAGEDVNDLRQWHNQGLLDRVDFYFGEIFQGSYADIYADALKFTRECGGRTVIFRNHSKIMAIHGSKFDCVIESSANVNTNPRSENTVLTVDASLTRDYITLLNGINSFNKDSKDVRPYEY